LSGLVKFISTNVKNAFSKLAMEVGPRLAKRLMPTFQRLAKFLSSPQFIDGVMALADAIGDFVDSAVPKVEAFVDGIMDGFSEAKKVIKDLGLDEIEDLDIDPEPFKILGQAVGIAAAAFTLLGATLAIPIGGLNLLNDTIDTLRLGTIADKILAIGGFIGGAAALIVGAAISLGSSIVDGIAAGIQAGVQAVVDAATAAAQAAINAAKAIIKPGSPSKVFEELGMSIGQGLEVGMNQTGPAVNAATAGLVRPDLASAAATANTNNVSVSAPASINISAAEDPEATAEAVRRILVGELADVFEQVSIQVGAV
jgi:hypothetical protein